VNGRSLRPPDDVERDGLVRVAAEAADLKIEVARVDRVAEGCAGPLNASMRLFQASQASLSASLRASAAMRTDVP